MPLELEEEGVFVSMVDIVVGLEGKEGRGDIFVGCVAVAVVACTAHKTSKYQNIKNYRGTGKGRCIVPVPR